MTIAQIHSPAKSAKPERTSYRLNGALPLGNDGIEAAIQRLEAVDALTRLLSISFATSPGMDAINPKLIASAFDGIAILNAEACFAIECENG